MDNAYISSIPIPACVVDPEGIVTAANPLMKNVFVYEDIIGYNFFTLTGVKREQLLQANTEEIIVDRNNRVSKLWVNEGASEDEDMVVFFDEATARESFRTRLESENELLESEIESWQQSETDLLSKLENLTSELDGLPGTLTVLERDWRKSATAFSQLATQYGTDLPASAIIDARYARLMRRNSPI